MSWSFPVTPAPEQEANYPALGFVPCPGDHPTASRVANDVRQTATALSDICHILNGTGHGDEWRGLAADAFRETFHDDFRPKVEAARDSFRTAAALASWAEYMPEAQEQARELEARAHEAQTALSALPAPKPVLGLPDGSGDEEDEEAEAERRRIERDREHGEQLLEQLRREARNLADDFREFGEDIADRIGEAIDIAPNKPGWLSGIADAIGGLMDAITDLPGNLLDAAAGLLADIGAWLVEHAAAIAAIGDVLAVVSTITGLAAAGLAGIGLFFPPRCSRREPSPRPPPGSLSPRSPSTGPPRWRVRTCRCAPSPRTSSAPYRSPGRSGPVDSSCAPSPRAGGANLLSGAALADSVLGTMENPSALQYFVPDGPRQWGQLGLGPGQSLLIGFENAWEANT
jgi:hypothetical protein